MGGSKGSGKKGAASASSDTDWNTGWGKGYQSKRSVKKQQWYGNKMAEVKNHKAAKRGRWG